MKSILFLITTTLTLTGCSSTLMRPITTAALSSGGAALGSHLTDGDSGGAAGGAFIGAAVSEGAFHLKAKSEQRAYRNGYRQALSDQTKAQYWQQQFQHYPVSSPTMQLPVPLPERVTSDGVRLVPSVELIPIHP